MCRTKPATTYRGTIEEVFRQKDEIPAGAIFELAVFLPDGRVESSPEDTDNRTLYEKYSHLFGTVHGLLPDLSERAEEYLASTDFGVTRDAVDRNS